MNRYLSTLTATAAATIALSVPAVLFAQAGTAKPGPVPAQKAEVARKAAPRGAALGLTAEQKTAMAAMREAQRKDVQASRETVRAARKAFREASRTEPFDEARVRAAVTALTAAQADAMVMRARHRAQFLSHLTPEQRAQLEARREVRARMARGDRAAFRRQLRGMRNELRREGVARDRALRRLERQWDR